MTAKLPEHTVSQEIKPVLPILLLVQRAISSHSSHPFNGKIHKHIDRVILYDEENGRSTVYKPLNNPHSRLYLKRRSFQHIDRLYHLTTDYVEEHVALDNLPA